MPTELINCPQCGSPACEKGGKSNEYRCPHCNALFVYVDPSHSSVTTDQQAHHCPICGRQVVAGKGFKCTWCEKDYFCGDCVSDAMGKYVCSECLEIAKRNCNDCKQFRHYDCGGCDKRACKEHAAQLGFIIKEGPDEGKTMFCRKCASYICTSCAKKKIFQPGYTCPTCGNRLHLCNPF